MKDIHFLQLLQLFPNPCRRLGSFLSPDRLCGSNPVPSVTSSTEVIFIMFVTNSDRFSSTGFKAQYQATDFQREGGKAYQIYTLYNSI